VPSGSTEQGDVGIVYDRFWPNHTTMFDMTKNEIKFLYNSGKKDDREAYGYALSLNKHKINELDVARTQLTSTQLSELAQKLNIPIIELFDEKSSYYRDNVSGKDIDENGLLTILKAEVVCLKTPIMIYENKAVFLESKYDTNTIDMAIEGITRYDTKQ
jgi:arsenate reductase-like glutaredoxin family protein